MVKQKIGLANPEGFDQMLCLDNEETDCNMFQLKSEKHELAVDI